MKLLRYGRPGQEKPGLVDEDGRIRDLSKIIKDITPDTLAPGQLAKLKKVKIDKLPKVSGKPRIGVPIKGIRKYVAIGLNYADHAKEAGMQIPAEPIVFLKATTCIVGPNDTVMLPKGSKKGDWEVELGVVIGRTARYVDEAKALDYVAGYCTCNDVSEREFQLERGGQWVKGKSADTFGPIGPWLVTKDEIKDPQKLRLWLDLNGKRVQNGSTATMIFGVAHLVSYVSRFMTLEPGDVITTGTPPGVGSGMKPQVFLKPGDVMRLGVDGLGEQMQRVVAHKG
ncbi:MAG TPA: fumarylacetoacetate hydrolase family protein [Candidatus Cybelea sp.]|nr:fumarylacetoacetate hydrolase family protein [Candidatus Cybelea sp.]